MRALTNGYGTIAQEIKSYTKDVGTELNYEKGKPTRKTGNDTNIRIRISGLFAPTWDI